MISILNDYKVKKYEIKNDSRPSSIFCTKVNKIYVINLKQDIIRRRYICMLMNKYNISFTLIVVEKPNDLFWKQFNQNGVLTRGEIGCCLSHLWCLRDIIKKKYENAVIFEDDIIFHKDFHTLFSRIWNPTFDFLLLGACDFSFSSMHYNKVNNGLYRIDPLAQKVYGAHANYYSLAGAKKMFELKSQHFSFFDSHYLQMFNAFPQSAFICYPNLVVSDISTTNLDHEYPFLSSQEKNYYKKCFVDFCFTDYHFIYLDLFIKNSHININENDTYETIITNILEHTFFNMENVRQIKNRLTLNFFTIKDVSKLISCL